MSSVGLNTLEGLAMYLKGPQEVQIDSTDSKKSKPESYPSSLIQAKVIRLEELRIKGLVLAALSVFMALVISTVVAGLHFSHPVGLGPRAWGLFYGRLGACGTVMLIGIAIASVSHWKLKKKLSNEEKKKIINAEESGITRYDMNLSEKENTHEKEKKNFEKHKNKIEELKQVLNKPAQ